MSSTPPPTRPGSLLTPWVAPTGLRPRAVPRTPRLAPLAEALDAVDGLDVDQSPVGLLADEVLALFRCVDRLHAMALRRLARVDAHGVTAHQAGTSTSSWLRHHAGLPSGTSSDLVRTARALRDRLPLTARALGDGDITLQHARTIARTATLVEARSHEGDQGAAVAEIEQVMVDVATSVDAGSLAGFSQRVRQVVDPDGALGDAERKHDRRWLSASTTIDGMVAIDGMLDGEAGALVLTALAAASAPRGPDDHRSAGQRRADALVDICGVSLDHTVSSSPSTTRPHLLVTAPIHALTRPHPSPRGRTPDAPSCASGSATDVGEASWAGPLLDETLRRLGCDASVRRILLDPASLPLDVGRSTRTVPAHLREALAVRDRGCVAEGCDRPVAWTEAHHVIHWAEGGRTSLDNLVLLCRAHHRKVHEGRWQFEQLGTAWRLVPPPAATTAEMARVTPSPSDAGAHDRTDDERDAGGGSTQSKLPKPGEPP